MKRKQTRISSRAEKNCISNTMRWAKLGESHFKLINYSLRHKENERERQNDHNSEVSCGSYLAIAEYAACTVAKQIYMRTTCCYSRTICSRHWEIKIASETEAAGVTKRNLISNMTIDTFPLNNFGYCRNQC